MGLFDGRVALVSGVGPGMGRSLALAYAREGADVVLGARRRHHLDDVAAEVEALGRRAVARPTDVTDATTCAALVEAGLDAFGRIDVLVNNAFTQPPMEGVAAASEETWRRAFDVNLLGAVRMTDAVLPTMRAAGRGAVVFVASLSARRVREDFAVYSATKSALLTTMQHYANEEGRHGIRANAIVPSWIWGPNLQGWFAHLADQRGVEPATVYDETAATTALRHLPTPDEVADAALAMSCELTRVVTGAALDVNAGEWFH